MAKIVFGFNIITPLTDDKSMHFNYGKSGLPNLSGSGSPQRWTPLLFTTSDHFLIGGVSQTIHSNSKCVFSLGSGRKYPPLLEGSDHRCDKMMQKKELLASALACAFTLILGLQAKESDRRSKVGIFNLVNPVQFKSDSCTGSSNSSLTGYMGLYTIYTWVRISGYILKNCQQCVRKADVLSNDDRRSTSSRHA